MGKRWTKRELKILEKYYFLEGAKRVQKRLSQEGFIKTKEAIRAKASRLDIKGKRGNHGASFKNLTGQIFTDWIKVKYDEKKSKIEGHSYYNVICRCGNKCSVTGNSLVGGYSKSCGHCNDIIIGKIYNEWIEPIEKVEDYIAPKSGKHHSQFKVKCHYGVEGCKGEFVTRAASIKSGLTRSCGCLQRELMSEKMGENHPCWKEEEDCITPLKERYYSSTQYRKMQNERFDLDNNCCIILGKLPRRLLTIHHKIPRNYYFKKYNLKIWEDVLNCKELWNINNLVTISEEWHLGIKTYNPLALHKLYNGVAYVEENYYTWLKERELYENCS